MKLFDKTGWRTAFGFQGVLLVVCAIVVLVCCNKIYFSEKFVLTGDCAGIEKEEKAEENKSKSFHNIFKIFLSYLKK